MTAVTAVPMSLPIVGPIVKRIRHRAPDQRVMIINESPEESCTIRFFVVESEADLGMFSMFGRTGAPQKGSPQKRTGNVG